MHTKTSRLDFQEEVRRDVFVARIINFFEFPKSVAQKRAKNAAWEPFIEGYFSQYHEKGEMMKNFFNSLFKNGSGTNGKVTGKAADAGYTKEKGTAQQAAEAGGRAADPYLDGSIAEHEFEELRKLENGRKASSERTGGTWRTEGNSCVEWDGKKAETSTKLQGFSK